jgi:hypothetical protein
MVIFLCFCCGNAGNLRLQEPDRNYSAPARCAARLYVLKTTIKRSIALCWWPAAPKIGTYLIDMYGIFVCGIGKEIILKDTVQSKKSSQTSSSEMP